MRLALVAGLLTVSAPVVAQKSPQPATASAPEEKKICRRLEVTGSYLMGKRECHTKAEWRRMSEEAQEHFMNRQSNRNTMKANGLE